VAFREGVSVRPASIILNRSSPTDGSKKQKADDENRHGQENADEEADMTEQEWLECVNPSPMLDFIEMRLSDRMLRLFAIACCTRVAHASPVGPQVIQVAEAFADGLVGVKELAIAKQRLQHKHFSHGYIYIFDEIAGEVCNPSARYAANSSAYEARRQCGDAVAEKWERQKQAEILRDITGNPFRPVVMNATWLVWNDCTVQRMAQQIYDERAWDQMPILADALQDAGCDDGDILDHCRSDGPHVRGCWVVDALLEKE
jgi:hypothetical protein